MVVRAVAAAHLFMLLLVEQEFLVKEVTEAQEVQEIATLLVEVAVL